MDRKLLWACVKASAAVSVVTSALVASGMDYLFAGAKKRSELQVEEQFDRSRRLEERQVELLVGLDDALSDGDVVRFVELARGWELFEPHTGSAEDALFALKLMQIRDEHASWRIRTTNLSTVSVSSTQSVDALDMSNHLRLEILLDLDLRFQIKNMLRRLRGQEARFGLD